MLNKLLDRLTDNYFKSENSNIGKLFSVISSELSEAQKAFIDIKRTRDVDNATNKTLDNIGKNVLEYRETTDDDLYRKWIKIKILANRSNGDIPVINHILETYMEDDFLSIEDGWRSYVEEPAAMVVNIRSKSKEIPFEVLNRIKSAGVRVYFTAGSETSNLIINYRDYTIDVPYKICNMFRTADTKGGVAKVKLGINFNNYLIDVNYPICNMFRTETILSTTANIEQSKEYSRTPYNRS